MNKILYADAAGRQFQHIYTKSHYALAGLLPLGLISPTDSAPAKLCDLGLALAIPVHSHIAMNFVVADYVPRGLQMPARAGVLGMSVITFLGLAKLALTGPGVTGAVKALWSKPQKQEGGSHQ